MVSCRNETLDFVIELQISEKIDLKKRVFITYYNNKPPVEIRFDLTDNEKKKINKQFNVIKSYITQEKLFIDDSCIGSPKLYTIITIGSGNKEKKLFVHTACEKYPDHTDMEKISRIKNFVSLIYEIVNSKPGVKDVPDSDIFYY